MPSTRILLIALALAGIGTVMSSRGDEPDKKVFFEKKSSEVVQCRVTLFLDPSFNSVEWRTRNVRLIKEAILDPLLSAKPDPRPARYVVQGSLTITRSDGSKETFTLFLPWGRIKRGDKYLIADLSKLPILLKGKVNEVIERLK